MDGIIVESLLEGTKVYSETPKEGFYYINKRLNKDFDYELSFIWVEGNYITPIIQIREIENMDIVTTFQRNIEDCWQMYTNAKIDDGNSIVDFEGHKDFKSDSLSSGNKIKLIKKGNRIKVYCSNKLVINYKISLKSDFYIGFGGHEMGNRYTIFKELTLKRIF